MKEEAHLPPSPGDGMGNKNFICCNTLFSSFVSFFCCCWRNSLIQRNNCSLWRFQHHRGELSDLGQIIPSFTSLAVNTGPFLSPTLFRQFADTNVSYISHTGLAELSMRLHRVWGLMKTADIHGVTTRRELLQARSCQTFSFHGIHHDDNFFFHGTSGQKEIHIISIY